MNLTPGADTEFRPRPGTDATADGGDGTMSWGAAGAYVPHTEQAAPLGFSPTT
ncbi:hypothetical protein GCM10027020_31650 [Nocardioides salsibiostraticola]